jgi:hypothetical protein
MKKLADLGAVGFFICALFVWLLIFVAGCMPTPDTPLNVESPMKVDNQRFQVTRVGVIEDNLAYQNRRGIYIIRDTKTEQEYIGVSGIGISEMGNHSSGKTSIADER